MDNAFKYHSDDHCEILLFEKYLIKQVKEGQTIIPDHAAKLKIEVDKQYNGKPFVYISNRIHSYSVDPLTYRAAEIMPNLMGIAIVTTEDKSKHAAYESIFFKKPFKIFDDLKKAIAWVDKVLENEIKLSDRI